MSIIEKIQFWKHKDAKFDRERAQRAMESTDKIRKSGIFAGGKTGAEIIREWRDKRR